jgi:hypothetical protein
LKAKKNYRNEDGEVITMPPNFVTSRTKKGLIGKGCTFSGVIPHVKGNDIENRTRIAAFDRAYHLSKL